MSEVRMADRGRARYILAVLGLCGLAAGCALTDHSRPEAFTKHIGAAVHAGAAASATPAPDGRRCMQQALATWATDYAAGHATIAILGDSLSATRSARSVGPSWVNLLLDMMTDRPVAATNYAVDGAQAWHFLTQRQADVQALIAVKPSLVVVMLGTNEWFTSTDAAVYEHQLDTLVGWVRTGTPSSSVLLVHAPEGYSQPSAPPWSRYGERMRAVAQRWGSAYLDLAPSFSQTVVTARASGLYQPDLMHLTTAGHQRMADLIHAELTQCSSTADGVAARGR